MTETFNAGRLLRKGVVQAVLGVVVLAIVVGGWWHAHRAAASGKWQSVLIVGDQRGGAQALLRAAGELDHVPYHIEWALFPAAAPLLEALNSSAIDIGGIGGQPFAFAYASGAKIKVVYAARQIDGPARGQASAIIVPANSPLRRIEDLKGRRIATVRGSAGQDLALRLLAAHGLKPGDVTWVYLNNAEAKSAQSGFYAANDTAIATKHAQIVDFLARLSRARRWAGAHKAEYAAVLAEETGLPDDVARFTINDYLTEPVPVGDNLKQEEVDILTRYKEAGIIDKVPDLSAAFDRSFPPDRD